MGFKYQPVLSHQAWPKQRWEERCVNTPLLGTFQMHQTTKAEDTKVQTTSHIYTAKKENKDSQNYGQ